MNIKQLTKEDIIGLAITHESDIPDVEPVITVGDCYFATKGGLSMVTGKTGSGKTTILRVMLSLTLSNPGHPQNFESLNMRAIPANGRFVFFLNTEMSDSSTKRKIHDGVLKDLGVKETPKNFRTISLIGYSPEERRAFISHLFEVVPDIHLLIIDGGADTVNSVNEEIQAVQAIEELNKIANNYQTTIINVVHENKGNGLTRGHYGQHCERKATGIISVKYDTGKKLFVISSVKSRETAQFQDVCFAFDERGALYQTGPASAAQRMEEAKENELLSLVLNGFKVKERWKLSEFKKWVAGQTEMSEKTAGRRVEEMFTAVYITTDGTGYIKSLVPVEDPIQLELV